jgi:hypothetical protein
MLTSRATGPRQRYREQEFWAEGGMICIEKRDTGAFRVLTRAEAAARAIALNQELKYMDDYPSDRKELSDCVVALCEAVKEAKRQGDPTKPEVARQILKQARKATMITGPSLDGAQIIGAGSISKHFRNIQI